MVFSFEDTANCAVIRSKVRITPGLFVLFNNSEYKRRTFLNINACSERCRYDNKAGF